MANTVNTVNDFTAEAKEAGITVESDVNGPFVHAANNLDLQHIIRATSMTLDWDESEREGWIVYPV